MRPPVCSMATSLGDGFLFDSHSSVQHRLSSAGVNVFGCKIIQALVIALGVVVLDKLTETCLQVAGQIIVFE